MKRFTLAALITVLATPVLAETDFDKAIAAGGTALSADEIATLIVGKTITAELGDKTFKFHYGADNVLTGQMVGGGWSGSGYYGITDTNQVCLSMPQDKGRLRCTKLVGDANGAVERVRIGN